MEYLSLRLSLCLREKKLFDLLACSIYWPIPVSNSPFPDPVNVMELSLSLSIPTCTLPSSSPLQETAVSQGSPGPHHGSGDPERFSRCQPAGGPRPTLLHFQLQSNEEKEKTSHISNRSIYNSVGRSFVYVLIAGVHISS